MSLVLQRGLDFHLREPVLIELAFLKYLHGSPIKDSQIGLDISNVLYVYRRYMTADTTAAKSIIVGKLAPNRRATAAAATPAKR